MTGRVTESEAENVFIVISEVETWYCDLVQEDGSLRTREASDIVPSPLKVTGTDPESKNQESWNLMSKNSDRQLLVPERKTREHCLLSIPVPCGSLTCGIGPVRWESR